MKGCLKYLILFVFVITSSVLSQNTKEESNNTQSSNYEVFKIIQKMTADDYTKLLDLWTKTGNTNFFALRMAYTKTTDYKPYSVKDDVMQQVLTNIQDQKYKEALDLLDGILKTDFVNIQAHGLEKYLYNKMADTVKANYEGKIYSGLLKSFYQAGDGLTPQSAFIVIAVDEEYDFIRSQGFVSQEQSLISQDGHQFDILKVKNNKTGEEYKLYFNVDISMDATKKMLTK